MKLQEGRQIKRLKNVALGGNAMQKYQKYDHSICVFYCQLTFARYLLFFSTGPFQCSVWCNLGKRVRLTKPVGPFVDTTPTAAIV